MIIQYKRYLLKGIYGNCGGEGWVGVGGGGRGVRRYF